jgi:hypothetical protein
MLHRCRYNGINVPLMPFPGQYPGRGAAAATPGA